MKPLEDEGVAADALHGRDGSSSATMTTASLLGLRG